VIAIRVILPLFLFLSSLVCVAQVPLTALDRQVQPSAIPQADVQLVQIGIRFYPDGSRIPIWAVMLGDTARAERKARMYRRLGPYGLNATLWTQSDKAPRWVRTTYRRPQNIDEFMAWYEDAAPFTFRQEGDNSLLPWPFAAFAADLIEKLEFIIRYDDGTAKAYLYPGTSAGDAEKFFSAVAAGN
jgi:hypothetical protein